jgi:ABC-type uncharacterized transport system auxiliary subunit
MFLRSVPSEIIAQRQFTSEASYRGDDVEAAVRAFNEALDDMSVDLVTWLSGLE